MNAQPTVTLDPVSAIAPYTGKDLHWQFSPIKFYAGSRRRILSSESIDRVVIMALQGDNLPLERLKRISDRKRAGNLLAGFNVTCSLDAWAFQRAQNFAIFSLPLLGKLADLGLLQHARNPATGGTLIHWFADNPWWARTESLIILARGGVDFDQQDWAGNTPHHFALAK